MFEITRFEGRQNVRGSVLLTVGFLLLAGLYIGLFPSIEASGVDFSQYLESLPEGFQSAFAVESINTIEGFLAIELYQFIWVLLFGSRRPSRGSGSSSSARPPCWSPSWCRTCWSPSAWSSGSGR
jgi:hypothetical protein